MNRKYDRSFRQQVMAALLAFGACLLALPASLAQNQTPPAKSFPDFPLQTGAGNVEPNIMFILDDSGSMAFEDMPNPDVTTICRRSGSSCASSGRHNITGQTYVGNTIYFNPAIDYDPWIMSSGSPMTGGTSMTAVYGSFNFAGSGHGGESDMIDLTDPGSCEDYDRNGSDETVCGGPQIFHVPKDPTRTDTSYLQNSTNYYRYEIHYFNGNPYVVRSELVDGGGQGAVLGTVSDTYTRTNIDDNSGTNALNHYFDLPAGASLTATTSGGSGSVRLRLYNPSGSTVCDRDTNGTGKTCSATNMAAGVWRVRLSGSNFDNVNLTVDYSYTVRAGCGSGSGWNWGNCTLVTQVAGQSVDELVENYATWFSYHRTRMKVAKSGASAAFARLGNNVRVGFRTIWKRNTFDIPVNDGNEGIFEGTSRETWFSRLFGARGRDGTPLRAALYDAGEYFSDSSSSGPYGPAAGAAQLACRQNFAVLTTDGYWNGSIGSRSIGDQDGTSGASIYNPKDETTAVRYTRVHPYRDTNSGTNYSNTLADVAMKYWKTDLRSDLDNIVPTGTQNPAFWQHMVTFGISIGLKGTLDQGSVAQVLQDGRPRRNGTDVNWPDPTDDENAERIDDLLHAAVNGHGEFIAATSADQFRDSLTSVLGQIQARLASGSNVATNSTTFQSDTRAFQATYRTGTWTGELTAYSVTAAGGISSTPDWRVSEHIASTYANGTSSDDFHRRTVLTWNASSDSGASFPTSAQETLLARSSGAASVTGANNAAYIKGDQSGELSRGGTLRNRTTPLGDIINSSPFYIRDTNTIYVGANDGMLHGIDALTGDVLFSYVPAGIDFAKLATLSDPAYGHAFFVDGPVTVSSYRVKSGTNYLVGTLGRGGRGAFALDVSDVRSSSANQRFTNNHVLWDHTASPDDDMGYVIGLPLIVRGNNDKVLAIVPNGIDSPNGSSALYVYDVADGTLLRKIVADPSGGGLSSPRAADLDGDAKVDYVYAGDMNGNVWKFDFTSSNPSSWGIDPDVNGPLFVATDDQGNRQPITGGLALAREPGTGRIWLTFGTGKLITISDLSSTAMQSWYGIIDGDAPIGGRATDLAERTIAATGTNAQGQKVRAFEAYSALPNGKKGWYLDFDRPSEGERVVSGARINGRAAFVSSIIPDVGDGCEAGGSGYLNVIDLFTGTSPQATGGNGSTSFFDLDRSGSGDNDVITGGDGNSLPIGSVDLGVGMPTESSQIDDLVLVCGSDGSCEEAPAPGATGGGKPRRTSWREIYGD
ncbi:PilC/PilY family type IV pilus protein [Pseudoxanthomonas suwonensis]|uniref:PilC/PilY family type IV pilus protein n=1 Tax=Pseudoxanthomonas suwonensis TaxID=314722 RepID=UPI0012DFCC35|nr:PilC/PilY family type IV pilus protein [Pseudoxanthomonas suwonensis]